MMYKWVAMQLGLNIIQTYELSINDMFLEIDYSISLLGLNKIKRLKQAVSNSIEYVGKNGFPLEFVIIDDDGNPFVSQKYIGWFDSGDKKKNHIPFTDEHAENIINYFDSLIEVHCEVDPSTGDISPYLYDNKVIIRYLSPNTDD